MGTQLGSFMARALEGAAGYTSNGTKQVAILFEILEGPYAGKSFQWNGYFTDNAKQATFDALFSLGWDGRDFVAFTGITTNEVPVTLEEDTYEGKTRIRVGWVNRQGGIAVKNRMSPAQAEELRAEFAADIAAAAKRAGRPPIAAAKPPVANGRPAARPVAAQADDIPF